MSETTTASKDRVVATCTIQIPITAGDVEDIVVSALEGGVGYWCRRIGFEGDESSDKFTAATSIRASNALLAGRVVSFDISDAWVELTLEKLLQGVRCWVALRASQGRGPRLDGERLDTSNIDVEDADVIVQYALFNKVMYG